MNALLAALKARDLNANRLAAMIEVAPAQVYGWTKGSAPIPDHQFLKVEEALTLTAEEKAGITELISDDHRAGTVKRPALPKTFLATAFRQLKATKEKSYSGEVKGFAAHLGINTTTLNYYLEGEALIPLDLVKPIAAYLSQKPDLIYAGLATEVAEPVDDSHRFARLRSDLSTADDRETIDSLLAAYDDSPREEVRMDPDLVIDRLGLARKDLDPRSAEVAEQIHAQEAQNATA